MLIQKLHPAMQPGRQLVVKDSGKPLFSRQGDWDGGSPLHCVAMALALLGKLADPVDIRRHTDGPDARFWDRAWPHYLHGLTLSELASFVWELNCGVRPVTGEGNPSAVLRFCVRELAKGWPVIVALCTRRRTHAALVVGIEGRQSHRHFTPHALLLLDPAAPEPGLASFNARLETAKRPLLLTTAATQRVTIEGAVSIRRKPP
ncbi:hypothetical protein PI87_02850 [Ralstonia sp. A12]|nr:hypothetical protein [Ralstonia sp. A12]KHK59003.1 hypothetical protein PI87_02850 [Ralstonia sp. A12]